MLFPLPPQHLHSFTYRYQVDSYASSSDSITYLTEGLRFIGEFDSLTDLVVHLLLLAAKV